MLQDPTDRDWLRLAEFSPDGSRVVTAAWDTPIAHIWDIATRSKLRDLVGHAGSITSIAFSLDGCRIVTARDCSIVTASKDGTARVWEVASSNSPTVLKYESPLLSAAFSSDGSRVATASEDKNVLIWDVASRRILKKLRLDGTVYSAAFSE